MSSARSIVVSGANGQLSQYLIKHLQEVAPDVRIIGTLRHKTARQERYLFDEAKVTFDLMDLADPHSIETVIARYQPTYLVNTAGNAFVADSWDVASQHLIINAHGVLHQLEAIRKHSSHTRYLNAGSSEVFGTVTESPQTESTSHHPRSPYGISKDTAYHITSNWRARYGLWAAQPYLYNFDSPIHDERYVTRKVTKGVARIAAAVRRGQSFAPIELGDLNAMRAWQHASDVAAAVWLILQQDTPMDYVISSGTSHTVRYLVMAAFTEAGIANTWDADDRSLLTSRPLVGPIRIIEPLVVINPSFVRPPEKALMVGDSSLARAELGWYPKVSLRELLSEMVQSDLRAAGL